MSAVSNSLFTELEINHIKVLKYQEEFYIYQNEPFHFNIICIIKNHQESALSGAIQTKIVPILFWNQNLPKCCNLWLHKLPK